MTVAEIDEAELGVLRRHWHPVARSDAIDDGPVGVVLLGEPVVVFRSGGRAPPRPPTAARIGAAR